MNVGHSLAMRRRSQRNVCASSSDEGGLSLSESDAPDFDADIWQGTAEVATTAPTPPAKKKKIETLAGGPHVAASGGVELEGGLCRQKHATETQTGDVGATAGNSENRQKLKDPFDRVRPGVPIIYCWGFSPARWQLKSGRRAPLPPLPALTVQIAPQIRPEGFAGWWGRGMLIFGSVFC